MNDTTQPQSQQYDPHPLDSCSRCSTVFELGHQDSAIEGLCSNCANSSPLLPPKLLYPSPGGPAVFSKAPFVELARACEVERSYEGDAGFDAFARVSVVVRPGEVKRVPLGVVFNPPAGWFCMVQEKSGMALDGVQTIGNIIDEGYRGEICAIIVNHGSKVRHFKEGEKVAQLVPMVRYAVATEDQLPMRGGKGFGSSGLQRFMGENVEMAKMEEQA